MPFPQIPSPPALFPTYLVPSLPFRRRKSSTDSNISSTSTTSSSSTAPDTDSANPQSILTGHGSHLRCARCAADIALSSQIISKGFTGRHGRAYLVAPPASSHPSTTAPPPSYATPRARDALLPNLPNTFTHKPVPRQLVTGAHTVGDISCAQCGSVLGWKYVAAEEEAQRYKVGKFILETRRVCRVSTWEGGEEDDEVLDLGYGVGKRGPPNEMPRVREEREEVEFDSQDEDECEDLFLGIWTPQLAVKRRRQKQFGRVEAP